MLGKKVKCFFTVLLISAYLPFSYFNCQRADAVVGGDDAVIAVCGGVTIGTYAVATAVGFALVAGGCYLAENTDSTDIKYIADGMVQDGEASKAFAVQTLATGEKVLSWTADGISYLGNKISSMLTTGSFPVTLDSSNSFSLGDISITSSDTTFVPIGPSFTLNNSDSARVAVNYIESSGSSYTASIVNTDYSSAVFQICYVFNNTYGPELGICTGGKIETAVPIARWDTTSLSLTGVSVSLPTGSVCNYPTSKDLSNYNQNTASDVLGSSSTAGDGSIDFQPKTGIPLTGSDVVGSDGTSSTVYSPSVDMPYGDSWSDTGSVAIPTTATGTQTGTSTDTSFWTSLWDWLQKILDAIESIPTAIQSLPNEIITSVETALADVFVPQSTDFTDFYNDLSNDVQAKFPYNIDILKSLEVGADEFTDIHITIWGHDCVIVSAQFVNNNISFIRIVTSCFWLFALLVYVWRKINSVLGGGDVNSTTVFTGNGGGGSGPPSLF